MHCLLKDRDQTITILYVLWDHIIYSRNNKTLFYFSVGTCFNIKSQGLFWGTQKNIGKKYLCFFKNPSPSEAAHIDLCFTWVDGYGGRAGGLHWFDLGGNGGAGFGGRVEFLPRVEVALSVLLLEAVFLWKHLGFGTAAVVVSGSGSGGSNGSANSLNSSFIVE